MEKSERNKQRQNNKKPARRNCTQSGTNPAAKRADRIYRNFSGWVDAERYFYRQNKY